MLGKKQEHTFTMDPMALIHPNTKRRILRPNLSDRRPMTTLEMATPIRVQNGKKYVAELKPKGFVFSKDWSDAPFVHYSTGVASAVAFGGGALSEDEWRPTNGKEIASRRRRVP